MTVTVSNSASSVNPDYDVKTSLDGVEIVQHVNVDSIPPVTIDSMPEVTVTGVATEATVSGIATSAASIETILSDANEAGFFSRVLVLIGFLVDYLRALPFVVPTALGHKVQALISTDSTMNILNTVSSVTAVSNLTNLNNIDSREIAWSMWLNGYNEGVRSKII